MKSKKTILIDLERLRYPYSGIANVFRNLAKGLDENKKDLDIYYFGITAGMDISAQKQISWKKWHKFFENFSENFGIVHVSHQLSSYFHKNYSHTTKIVTLHDLNFLHENLSEAKRKKMLKKVNKNLINADYIVCISNFAKKDFEENKHRFTLNKLRGVEVIHNGILLPENINYDLGRFHEFKNKNYIVSIGVLFDKKNQIKLVQMLQFLECDLVLIASGEKEPYATEVRNKITELKLEKRVYFLKNISEEEKYALIQNSESLCHPSIAEGFGIPPIEAMAFGKPVFLSTSTSLPEIGGDCAFYFENFDSKYMADFYSEKINFFNANKEVLIPKLKIWTQQFNYNVMSKNYLELYKKIFDND